MALTEKEVHALPQRRWATRGDEAVPGDPCDAGHHASSEAIGGYYGMAWCECFKDAVTGEVYSVRCFDGVYQSKEAYEDE